MDIYLSEFILLIIMPLLSAAESGLIHRSTKDPRLVGNRGVIIVEENGKRGDG